MSIRYNGTHSCNCSRKPFRFPSESRLQRKARLQETPLSPERSAGQTGWYVVVEDGEDYDVRSIGGGRKEAIEAACRFLEQGLDVIEVGQFGGFVHETLDADAIKAVCAA